MVDITEPPGNRLSTKRVTIRRASDPDELRAIGAEYAALADYLEGITPVDEAQVAAIEQVVLAASEPVPAETPRGAAARLYQGGLRKVGG